MCFWIRVFFLILLCLWRKLNNLLYKTTLWFRMLPGFCFFGVKRVFVKMIPNIIWSFRSLSYIIVISSLKRTKTFFFLTILQSLFQRIVQIFIHSFDSLLSMFIFMIKFILLQQFALLHILHTHLLQSPFIFFIFNP